MGNEEDPQVNGLEHVFQGEMVFCIGLVGWIVVHASSVTKGNTERRSHDSLPLWHRVSCRGRRRDSDC